MEENYYASPEPFEPMPKQQVLSGYVRGWAIADLVFCTLKVPLIALGVFVLADIAPEDPCLIVLCADMLTGVGICSFGIPGNIMLLMGKPWSILICWFNVAFTLGNILVWGWYYAIQFSVVPDSDFVFAILTGSVGLMVRFVLLGFYCSALVRAKELLTPP